MLFNKDFMLGAATAAHQVEGNNTKSDYWVMENIEHSMFAEKSGLAVDHYNRYKEDIDLLKQAGLNAYRFSIEWARIEPIEGQWDEKEMNQTYMTLNDNTRIPQFGIGVFQVPPEKTAEVVKKALEMGVRHIDTAHAYQNEKEVGIGMKESGVPREEIFLTTKLWPSEYGEGVTSAAIDKMLKRLGTDYIDLLLLHQPFNDYVGAWKDMERAVKDGRVKSIGLSNFDNERLDDILKIARIKPSVIQVECHPYYQQIALKEKIKPYDIALESWYPLGHADKDLLNEAVFTRLGQKYHKTNAQIILRWHIQENNIIFPRTMNPVHMKENAEIFDFELTASEMDEIRSLDKGKRFFNMPLNELEKNLGKFTPKD